MCGCDIIRCMCVIWSYCICDDGAVKMCVVGGECGPGVCGDGAC